MVLYVVKNLTHHLGFPCIMLLTFQFLMSIGLKPDLSSLMRWSLSHLLVWSQIWPIITYIGGHTFASLYFITSQYLWLTSYTFFLDSYNFLFCYFFCCSASSSSQKVLCVDDGTLSYGFNFPSSKSFMVSSK